MKKTVVVASILAILLSACSQIPGFNATPATGPTVDTAAATSAFNTAVAQSLTAQPTLPLVSVTDTATLPVASFTLPPTNTALPNTPIPATIPATSTLNLTTTPATATVGPAANATATLGTGQPIPTWTLGVRTYGTLPPAVPFNQITLINRAKVEAYISLHVDLQNGNNSVIEYPVQGVMKIKAPIGPYSYVAWVGGNKMIGTFRLSATDSVTITLYKDKVVVQ